VTRWIAVGVALLATACASVEPAPSVARAERRAAVPGFSFSTDTFTFPNEIRARTPWRPDLYANYCFVLARGLRQFFAFARFDPQAPRLTSEAYVERVREIAAHQPWDPPPAPDDRVVIPGYANLREFSRGQEAAVKAGLGGRFWTLMHWTNWRVTFPVTRGQQAEVAREVMEELDAGRLAQLLVTNWPKPELNHTVVAYAYRSGPSGVEFVVWDPNEPGGPGLMTFDTEISRFRATRLYDTEPGLIRAFRMYYSWWL
jgi:hypothetical protein